MQFGIPIGLTHGLQPALDPFVDTVLFGQAGLFQRGIDLCELPIQGSIALRLSTGSPCLALGVPARAVLAELLDHPVLDLDGHFERGLLALLLQRGQACIVGLLLRLQCGQAIGGIARGLLGAPAGFALGGSASFGRGQRYRSIITAKGTPTTIAVISTAAMAATRVVIVILIGIEKISSHRFELIVVILLVLGLAVLVEGAGSHQ